MSDHKQHESKRTQLTQGQLEYAYKYLDALNKFVIKNKKIDLAESANEFVKNTGQCFSEKEEKSRNTKETIDFKTIQPNLSELKKIEGNENDLIYKKNSETIRIRIARIQSNVDTTNLKQLSLGGKILLDSIDTNIKNEIEKHKITGFSNNTKITKEIFSGYPNKNPVINEDKDKYFFSEEFINFIPEKMEKIKLELEELKKHSGSKESKEKQEKICRLEAEIQKFPIQIATDDGCNSNKITLNSKFSGENETLLKVLNESKVFTEFSENSFKINTYGQIEIEFDTKENAKIVFDVWDELQNKMVDGLTVNPADQPYLPSTLGQAINDKKSNLFTTHYPKPNDPYTWSIRTAPTSSEEDAAEVAITANQSIRKNKLKFEARVLEDHSVEIVRQDRKPLHYGFAVNFYKEPTVELTLAEESPLSNLQRLNYWAGEHKKAIAICGIALGTSLVGPALVGKYVFGDAKHLFNLDIPSTHLTAGGALGIAIGGMLFCMLMYGLYKNRHEIKEKTTETWCRFFGSGHRSPLESVTLGNTPLLEARDKHTYNV